MINEVWIGNYTSKKSIVNFELHLENLNDSFVGYRIEEPLKHLELDFPKVKGFIYQDQINFIVTYPFLYTVDEAGNTFIDPSRAGHEVHYDGYWNEETDQWIGDWEIIIKKKRVDLKKSILTIKGGTFQLKRG